MRLVQFKNTGRVIEYPAEGVGSFGKTHRNGDYIVGEYHGDDSSLVAYTGQWPIVESEAPVYSQLEFMEALGDQVSIEIIEGAAPALKLIEKKFNAASTIDTADPRTESALDYLVASAEVPSFTTEDKARICAPVIS
jgi:hypothetical protein